MAVCVYTRDQLCPTLSGSPWRLPLTPKRLLTRLQFIKALGAFKPPRNVIRSHVVVAKGGKIVSSHIQISPGDSFAKAVATVADVAKSA